MTTYVLVPGAWHGPTAWDRVVPLLERAGARTVTIDLAATPATGLDEHVQQVIEALDALEEPTFAAPAHDTASETPAPSGDAPHLDQAAPHTPETGSNTAAPDIPAVSETPAPGGDAPPLDRAAPHAPAPGSDTAAPGTPTTSPRTLAPSPETPARTTRGAPAHTPPTAAALSQTRADNPRRVPPTPGTTAPEHHDRVVLVGHSYAGLVVRQAADRRPERVEHLILIDAWVGPDGAGLFTLAPEAFADKIRAAADENGLIPAPAPAMYGVTDPDDVEWVRDRLRPHPLRTFTDTTTLTGAVDLVPGTALYCVPQSLPFDRLAEKLGYRTVPVDGPHDLMVTDPETVARYLLDIPQVQNQEAPELQ
ncbi:hypothetical protein GCM10010486_90180 [Nonomuraea roseoviolacea subsp. carminata]